MSESSSHLQHVRGLDRFVRILTTGRDDLIVRRDEPGATKMTLPPMIGGYRPDLFARLWRDNYVILGEAKTAKDLDYERTWQQIRAFLAELSAMGRGSLILCTDFGSQGAARALLWNVCAEFDGFRSIAIYCIHPEQTNISDAMLRQSA